MKRLATGNGKSGSVMEIGPFPSLEAYQEKPDAEDSAFMASLPKNNPNHGKIYYKIAWVYGREDGEKILRQNGWIGEIKYRPMTKYLKRKHGWGRDNDPGGPWGATMSSADKL